MTLTGNTAIIKNKSDEKLRWKVTITLSNREARNKSIPAAKLIWGNKIKTESIKQLEMNTLFTLTLQNSQQ